MHRWRKNTNKAQKSRSSQADSTAGCPRTRICTLLLGWGGRGDLGNRKKHSWEAIWGTASLKSWYQSVGETIHRWLAGAAALNPCVDGDALQVCLSSAKTGTTTSPSRQRQPGQQNNPRMQEPNSKVNLSIAAFNVFPTPTHDLASRSASTQHSHLEH